MNLFDQRIEDVFRGTFHDDSLTITDETTSEHVARWDSLGHLQLLSAVEREFRLKFTLDETISITSVRDLKQIIHARAARA